MQCGLFCKCQVDLFETHQYPKRCWVTDICEFTFAPSIHQLAELDQIGAANWGDENIEKPTWVAWGHLLNLEWSHFTSRDFLRKKELKYLNAEECRRSVSLLKAHTLSVELRAIYKKSQGQCCILFYNRNNTEMCLKIVLDKLYDLAPAKQDSNLIVPYALRLKLEDEKYLLLEVEWTKDLVEVCILTSFNDHSKPLQAIVSLIENPGKLVQIAPVKAPGINSSKILRRIGICKVLENIFISSKTGYEAALRSEYVILSEVPNLNKKKLLSMIPKLKNAESQHCNNLRELEDQGRGYSCWYFKSICDYF